MTLSNLLTRRTITLRSFRSSSDHLTKLRDTIFSLLVISDWTQSGSTVVLIQFKIFFKCHFNHLVNLQVTSSLNAPCRTKTKSETSEDSPKKLVALNDRLKKLN